MLKELKEAARVAKLAQRKSDIKAAVAFHKAAGAKRLIIFSLFFSCFLP